MPTSRKHEAVTPDNVDAHLIRAGVRLSGLKVELKEMESLETELSDDLKFLLATFKMKAGQKKVNVELPIPGDTEKLDIGLTVVEIVKPIPNFYDALMTLILDKNGARLGFSLAEAEKILAQYVEFVPQLKPGGLEAMLRDGHLTPQEAESVLEVKEQNRLTVKRK